LHVAAGHEIGLEPSRNPRVRHQEPAPRSVLEGVKLGGRVDRRALGPVYSERPVGGHGTGAGQDRSDSVEIAHLHILAHASNRGAPRAVLNRCAY
jgi:hypothetical protein